MCSEVLWKAIIGAGELVRTLSELHLVNNDPDVTRAILYVAHNHPDVSGMLTGSDRNGGSSSNDMDVDWDRDRESSQRREAGGHHYGDEGRSSGAASDRQLLITFETEDEKHKTSTQHDEEMMLFGGQWVPKSQLPQTAAPKPSENVDRHIRTAGSSKTDDTEEERKSGLLASFAPFRDIPEKVGSFLGSPGAAISTMLSPTAPTRADVHKVDPSLMVPSAEKTALKCGACARQPNSNNAEWFVQLPCSHYSCISCFNSRVQKTHDTSCSNCSKTFELPTPANKSQFLFCPDPKGESYVLNPKDNVRSELEYYRMYKIQYSNEFNVNNLYL